MSGVRQGAFFRLYYIVCLACILMSFYIIELSQSKYGCHWYSSFAGALAYADDITLLAPSPSALRKLLICDKFGVIHKMKFTPEKTHCIRFCKVNTNQSRDTQFLYCGKHIALSASVTHLGHKLTSNLRDEQDIQRCLLDFVKHANSTL